MAFVQLLLNSWRRRHRAPGLNGEEAEDGQPPGSAEGAVTGVAGEGIQIVSNGGEDADGGMQAAQDGMKLRKFQRPLIFNKARLEERLVLEQEMVSHVPRCCLFMVQFLIFLVMLWTAYPADTLLPIHQALMAGVKVAGSSPTDLKSIEDLKAYLPGLAAQWKSFSPGSSAYVEDPGARKYISGVTSTPPVINLGSEVLQPKIGSSFTFVAWIRTAGRFDTLMKKVQQERGNAICWQFDLERISYGQHEAFEPIHIVHPLAEEIWKADADDEKVWKTSAIRSNISDGHWHQYAVMVERRQVTFFLDGVKQGEKSLPRSITDCESGTVTIGSALKNGDLVDVQYIPRLLSVVDLNFLRTMGRLPDEVLSGSGVSEAKETNMEQLQRMSQDGISNTNAQHLSARESLLGMMRQLHKALVNNNVQGLAIVGEELNAISASIDAVEQSLGENQPDEQTRRLAEKPGRRRSQSPPSSAQSRAPDSVKTMAQSDLPKAARSAALHAAFEPRRMEHMFVRDDELELKRRLEDDHNATSGGCSEESSCLNTMVMFVLDEMHRSHEGGNLTACLMQNGIGSRLTVDMILARDVPRPGGRHPALPDDGSCDHLFPGCDDTANGATDSDGSGCERYDDHPEDCGLWDTPDFQSNKMCCACGLGGYQPRFCSNIDPGARSLGGDYECNDWYGDVNDCSSTQFDDDDFTVRTMCCACGGGDRSGCEDWANGATDSSGDSCEWYDLFPESCGRYDDFDFSSEMMCCACGGFQAKPTLADEVMMFLKRRFASIELIVCDVFPEYKEKCPASCSACPITGDVPSRDDVLTGLLECDDKPYKDFLGQDCSFYAVNDAATDDAAACSRYAGDDARAACLRTCGTCDYSTIFMSIFDLNTDEKINSTEYGLLSSFIDIRSGGLATWHGLVKEYMCQDQEACWGDEIPELNVSIFQGFPNADPVKAMRRMATGMLEKMEVRIPFFELEHDTDGSALRFGDAAIISGETSYSLQKETFEPVFISCDSHSTCEDMAVTACGDIERASNILCSRGYEVRMFCATKCHTGGCGSDGSVLPMVAGAYCQPCDACAVEDSSFSCPDWCDGYIIKADGHFDKMDEALVAQPYARPLLERGETNLPGSFTLSAWVKSFETQWLFERKIRIPGLSEREGYDQETGMLTCWQVSPFELLYRNRWDEKVMTIVENPLSDLIMAENDLWHFVAIRKHSYMTNKLERLEELRWLVDGTLSDLQFDALSGKPILGIPAMGFPDCGGMLLSKPKASSVAYEGPDHFYDDLMIFVEWWGQGGLWVVVDEDKLVTTDLRAITMPLTPGRHGATVFSFSNLGIPAGSIIKGARIDLTPAVPFFTHLSASRCGNEYSKGTSRIKIAGLKVSPDLMTPERKLENPNFLCEVMNQSDVLSREEVVWEIDEHLWRLSGVPQTPPPPSEFALDKLGNDVATMHSPDLTAIVEEMFLWSRESGVNSMTFVLSQADREWGKCGDTSLFESEEEKQKYESELQVLVSDCDQVKRRSEFMEEKFPLWVIPPADEDRLGASSPQLIIEYCLNEECISPSFLGAGESARDTRAVHAAKAAAAEEASARRLRSSEAKSGVETKRRQAKLFQKDCEDIDSEACPAAPAAPTWAPRRLPAKSKASTMSPKLSQSREAAAVSKKQATLLPEVGRRLQVENMTKCTAMTCLVVGDVLDAGLTTRGMMHSPMFSLRMSETSQLQQTYYQGIPVLKPHGQIELTGARELKDNTPAKVLPYPREVVSIIPPIIFQRRSRLTSCETFTPGLAESLETYFENQTRRRCSESYACSQISGFSCVDRDLDLPEDQVHWGTKSLRIDGSFMYPEFFEMFSVPTLFRTNAALDDETEQGDMVSTADWLDVQTAEVVLVNLFLAPKQRVGTVMTLKWSISAAKVSGSVDTKSFVQMSPEERSMWAIMNLLVGVFATVDLFLVAASVVSRFFYRRDTMRELTKKSPLSAEREHIAMNNLPLFIPADIFDIALRIINVVFALWHSTVYPAPTFVEMGGETKRLEYLEQPLKEILDLKWSDPTLSTQEKVDEFMTLVVSLNENLRDEENHRTWAKIMVLLFFVRVVVYMRVHPRIAILYSTLIDMWTDFIHFLFLAATLFCVLAFLGTWSFGDKNPDFGDFQTSLYTQFRMICGEYGFPTGEDAGFQFTFGLYSIIYFLFVFSLLLNFFLAIVIDSYASVKDTVKNCKIENSVVWDIGVSFLYPIIAPIRGWPQRDRLITSLMRCGAKQEKRHSNSAITANDLVDLGILPSMDSAKSFMWYYNQVCPTVGIRPKDKADIELHHQKTLRRRSIIDSLWIDICGEPGQPKKMLEDSSKALQSDGSQGKDEDLQEEEKEEEDDDKAGNEVLQEAILVEASMEDQLSKMQQQMRMVQKEHQKQMEEKNQQADKMQRQHQKQLEEMREALGQFKSLFEGRTMM